MAHLPALGADATLLDVYKRYPSYARHLLGLAEAAFTLTDEIARGEAELLGAYVSALNGCSYCAGIHGEAAAACGIDRSVLVAADRYGGERWRPLFAYLRKATLEPRSVTREDVDAMLDAGWSQDAVAQCAMITTVFNSLNRLADGLGLVADSAFFEAAGKRLATVGYGGTAEMLALDP